MKEERADHIRPIYPARRNPYYIVTPRYVRTSAGIKSLHLLCHSLNSIGENAYLLIHPYSDPESAVLPDLLTPTVSQHVIDYHFREGLTPIVVYPETVAGNPFGAPCVARYVLNFPGLLGGDTVYDADEYVFGYSKVLAEAAGVPERVLFIPATDTRIFYPPDGPSERKGSCYFAAKYKTIHNGTLQDITKDSFEITRDLPDSLTPEEIAALFRRSEVFYTYENTALAVEAVMCGCPAVFIPNEHLTEIIAIKELGPDGYAWGTAPADLTQARASVMKGRDNYLRLFDLYWQQLGRFVAETQAHVKARPYTVSMRVPEIAAKEGVLYWMGLVFTAGRVLKREGPLSLLCHTGRKIMKMLRGEVR